MPGFDSFLNAISGQESGGSYSVVNKDSGALGRWQVMPANVGAWSREILGYSVSTSQFLNSPELQNAIVRGKLKKYYDQYGARGAAAAWYSGDPRLANDTRSQNGYPSIKSYVDQVMARTGGDYGVTTGSTADNRVAQTSLQDLYAPKEAEQVDALSGTDVKGLGLKQADAGMGLDANTGGVGTAAPQVSAPATDTGSGKRTAGEVAADRGTMIADLQRTGDAGRRGAVIDLAKQYIGTPYVWGGTQPGGLDCSGLIQLAMKQAGISVPRVSWDQLAMGQRTDVKNLQPGDLVGFHGGSHVALYLGNGQILEAPRTGLNVRIRSLGNGSFDQSAFGVSLGSLYK